MRARRSNAVSLRTRSGESELMDDPRVDVDTMRATLREVDAVNRRLGGWSASRWLLARRLAASPRGAVVSLLDLGAGSGAGAVLLSRDAARRGVRLQWTLADVHPAVCRVAAADGPVSARVVRADALRLPFADRAFDYVHASLVLHHFASSDVEAALLEMRRVARRGFVVNDLERHPIAHRAIAVLTRLFARSRLVRHDAPASVRRGFHAGEVRAWSRVPGLETLGVRKRFPFRLLAWSFEDGGRP